MSKHKIKMVLKDTFFSILVRTGIIGLKKLDSEKFYIVTFHRVLPNKFREKYPFSGLVVTPEELSWFLRVFSEHFDCGSLSNLYSQWNNGRRGERPFLAITFDDGQLDNYMYAKPVLDEFGIKATFYVPTNAIDDEEILWHDRLGFSIIYLVEKKPELVFKVLSDLGLGDLSGNSAKGIARIVIGQAKLVEPSVRNNWVKTFQELSDINVTPDWNNMMDWDLLSELAQEGHEIGSHSVSHDLLSQLTKEEIKREVKESKVIIEKKLKIEVDSFCYPNGDYNLYTKGIVDAAGYKNAVTTNYGSNEENNSFTLKRFDMVTANNVDRNNNLSLARLTWRMSVLFELWNNK